MKVCECGNIFKSTIVINGKRRNLSNRTKCLKCVPFGTSNYKVKSVEEIRTKNAEKSKRYYHRYKIKNGIDPVKMIRSTKKKLLVDLFGSRILKRRNVFTDPKLGDVIGRDHLTMEVRFADAEAVMLRWNDGSFRAFSRGGWAARADSGWTVQKLGA